MFKLASPQNLEFTIDHKVVLSAKEDGSFYDANGNKLDRDEVYFIFSKWTKSFGEQQLGWPQETSKIKCDCGGKKSNTTHSYWCSVRQGENS